MMRRAFDKVRNMLGYPRVLREYSNVFSTPSGEAVLLHICRVGNVFKTSFTSGDPYQTAFEEGKRNLALSILRAARRDPMQLQQLLQEGVEQHEPNEQQS